MSTRGSNLTDLMQAQFSNGNKLPFGPNMGSGVVDWATVHTRWVTTAIKAGLVRDGHPKSVTIDVMTSLGHLCDVIGLRANFVVEIDAAKLRTHLGTFAKTNPGITSASAGDTGAGTANLATFPGGIDPFWGLENINFLPNAFRNMIDEWIMRHNGAEVDHKDTRQLNLMGMDQYFKEEAKYYSVLMNGREEGKLKHLGTGGPSYIYFDEEKQVWTQRNHNHQSTEKIIRSSPSSSVFHAGFNPAVNIRPGETMDRRVYVPQLEELAGKSTDKDVHSTYDQYYSDLYTVIALRDLARQRYSNAHIATDTLNAGLPFLKGRPIYTEGGVNTTRATAADGTTLNVPLQKTIDDIVAILGGQKFTFPMEYVLQTVFHRHMKDAVDILNFVNNPEFEITFNHFNHWIQNYSEVGAFVDLRLENFEVVTRYHDVTRTVWDREFSGRGQITRPLVDFQWHHNNFTAKFTAGGDPAGADAVGKTIVHKIWPQNLDNIVRMVYILIQSREHFDKLNYNNIAHKYYDILEAVEWKINGEIFGKKTMTDVDQKVRTNFHYTKKKSHSVTRDQTWVHNMSFDMDMNNYKGGTINLLPIANNNEWVLTFSIPKMIALFNSSYAEAGYQSLGDIESIRLGVPDENPATTDLWTTNQIVDSANQGPRDRGSGEVIAKGSMFRSSLGSPQGAIRRTRAATYTSVAPVYDYEINLLIALQCQVPNIYMQQEGQSHAVRRLPGKA